MRPTDTPAARTTVSSLSRARPPSPMIAADQRADRQQLVGLLRQLQERDEERAGNVVAALPDVVLLADEGHERHQREQHGHDHQRVQEDRPGQVAVEDRHVAYRLRRIHRVTGLCRWISTSPAREEQRVHPPRAGLSAAASPSRSRPVRQTAGSHR